MTPDVIVIGAGIIGCTCAYTLAAGGADVRCFERRGVGRGASQASAGVLAPFIEGHDSGPLRQLGHRSLRMFDRFVRDVTEVSGRGVQFSSAGSLEVAFDTEAARRLAALGDRLMGEGITARWLDGPALRTAEPLVASSARGALLIPSHGFVSVPDLVEALAAAAVAQGAVIAADTRVISLDEGPGGRVAVETEDGVSFADAVVLAAGSWTDQVPIVEAAPTAVRPIRGQLLHLSWPTHHQALTHVIWGPDCYLVPWSNGRVLVGATTEDVGFDERATVEGVRQLIDAGGALVPALKHASFAEVRVGLRPASGDALPIIGRSAAVPGVIYATGHFRNGVLLAPLTGALVADLVFDRPRDPALDLLLPSRFGPL